VAIDHSGAIAPTAARNPAVDAAGIDDFSAAVAAVPEAEARPEPQESASVAAPAGSDTAALRETASGEAPAPIAQGRNRADKTGEDDSDKAMIRGKAGHRDVGEMTGRELAGIRKDFTRHQARHDNRITDAEWRQFREDDNLGKGWEFSALDRNSDQRITDDEVRATIVEQFDDSPQGMQKLVDYLSTYFMIDIMEASMGMQSLTLIDPYKAANQPSTKKGAL